jgi:hypothetical protein
MRKAVALRKSIAVIYMNEKRVFDLHSGEYGFWLVTICILMDTNASEKSAGWSMETAHSFETLVTASQWQRVLSKREKYSSERKYQLRQYCLVNG